jgi:hypothetical protein
MTFRVRPEKQVLPRYEPAQRGSRRGFRRIHAPQQNRAHLFCRIGGGSFPYRPHGPRQLPRITGSRLRFGQAVCSPAKTSASARLFCSAVERAADAETLSGERRVRQPRKRKTRRRVPAPVKYLQAELRLFEIMLFSPLLPVPAYGVLVLQSS